MEDFIKSLRELRKKLEESQIIAEQAKQVSQQIVSEQFARMIEEQPELYGKSGSKRNWLESEAEKFGLDGDFIRGVDDGEGPWNQPN